MVKFRRRFPHVSFQVAENVIFFLLFVAVVVHAFDEFERASNWTNDDNGRENISTKQKQKTKLFHIIELNVDCTKFCNLCDYVLFEFLSNWMSRGFFFSFQFNFCHSRKEMRRMNTQPKIYDFFFLTEWKREWHIRFL